MRLRYVGFLVLMICGILPKTDAAVMNVDFVPGATQSIPGLTGSATLGSQMSGMTVLAVFNSGMAGEYATWSTTGAESGEAKGFFVPWTLTLDGNTISANWTLTNNTDFSLTRLVIDGLPGNTVFDVSDPDFPGQTEGTPGSSNGFTIQSGSPQTLNATYRDEVQVMNNGAVGDLFRILEIDIVGGLDSGASLSFVADTDSVSTVPEPSAIAGLGSLVACCAVGFCLRRRRRDNVS